MSNAFEVVGKPEVRQPFTAIGQDGFVQEARTLLTTRHWNGAIALTAFVDNGATFPRSIGGTRIVKAMQIRDAEIEVVKLAAGMAKKNPAAGIPATGQKTVVIWPDVPNGAEDKARLLAAHYEKVLEWESGAIFGPDMNVGEDVQDILSMKASLHDHVTGLSLRAGGVSIDGTGYTGRALVSALGAWSGVDSCRSAAIQGFGSVGAWAAKTLIERYPHIRVVALSNQFGTAVSDQGLPIEQFFDAWFGSDGQEAKDRAVETCARELKDVSWHDQPSHIWEVRADLFVPAARTSVLRASNEMCEQEDAFAVEDWSEVSGVKAVLEGANSPVTYAAEEFLSRKRVVVFPDFVVNAGGVWGCWLEWALRKELLASASGYVGVDREAQQIITKVVTENMRTVLKHPGSARTAAEALKNLNIVPVAALWETLTVTEVHERAASHARSIDLSSQLRSVPESIACPVG